MYFLVHANVTSPVSLLRKGALLFGPRQVFGVVRAVARRSFGDFPWRQQQRVDIAPSNAAWATGERAAGAVDEPLLLGERAGAAQFQVHERPAGRGQDDLRMVFGITERERRPAARAED